MKVMSLKANAKLIAAASLLGVLVLAPRAQAELPSDAQAKVEKYKKRLSEWARDPVVLSAVKEANAHGGIAGMSNSKWDSLLATDAAVLGIQTSEAGRLLTKLEEDQGINKLYLRDLKGNIVAASSKPLLYSIASRPAMQVVSSGQPWAQGEVKPDPTTQIKSVQMAVPVMDGGKAVGVLHTGVTID